MHNLPYARRLEEMGALSLQNKKIYDDMVFIYEAAHGLMNYAAEEFGIRELRSRTRSCGIRLVQKRAITCTVANLYSLRVPSQWNKLPLEIKTVHHFLLLRTNSLIICCIFSHSNIVFTHFYILWLLYHSLSIHALYFVFTAFCVRGYVFNAHVDGLLYTSFSCE